MSKPEDIIQQEIQIASFPQGCSLMRNNSGALKDKDGRFIRFGLGNTSKQRNEIIKSSDLIGFTRIVITQEMVGSIVAIFTAVEVKKEEWKPSKSDKREKGQRAFIDWIIANGGFAGFANCVDTFLKIIKR